jgi:hypothetical protein
MKIFPVQVVVEHVLKVGSDQSQLAVIPTEY